VELDGLLKTELSSWTDLPTIRALRGGSYRFDPQLRHAPGEPELVRGNRFILSSRVADHRHKVLADTVPFFFVASSATVPSAKGSYHAH
jgi:hypothetical protein